MAYITNADVIERIGTARAAQLSAESGTTPDTALIDKYIADSEGVANGWLAAKTTVPVLLATAPNTFAAVAGRVLDMVRYHLATRRDPVPEDWKTAHDEAVAWFKAVATGEVILPDDSVKGTQGAWGSSDPVSGRDNMKGL